jgi:hypothetical protein
MYVRSLAIVPWVAEAMLIFINPFSLYASFWIMSIAQLTSISFYNV